MRNGKSWLAPLTAAAALSCGEASGEVFELEPIVVESGAVHPSQRIRKGVEGAMNESRTSSTANGSTLQNINPVNKRDALRYNSIGTIGGPGSGTRFGGTTKLRTFGDFGAAESIDGLPAFKSIGSDGSGYQGTAIPSIAVDRVTLEKGGRGVGYGDGSDGGVIVTHIKDGRGYDDHVAVSADVNTADEIFVQGEYADSDEDWDIYGAVNHLEGWYDGEPPDLDHQRQFGGLTKIGLNYGPNTRIEMLGIGEYNRPNVIRAGNVEEIASHTYVGVARFDHRIDNQSSIAGGWQHTDTWSEWPARNRDRSIDTHVGFFDGFHTADLGDGWRFDGTAGAEYKRTNVERDNQFDLLFHDFSLKARSAFTLHDNLVVSLGVRPTYFINDLEVNGVGQADNLETPFVLAREAGLAYTVFGQTRIRGSYATGYNRFYEKYGNFGTDALNPAGAEDEIVDSRTLEAGIRQGWTGGYADVAVYNIVQENVPRRNGGAIESVTVDQSGLEFEAEHGFGNGLYLSAGFMYLYRLEVTRANGASANGNVFFGNNGVPVPTLQALIRADYNFAEDWVAWGMGYYNSGFERTDAFGNVTNTREFIRVDLGAAWQPRDDFALRFRAENVLNQRDFGQTLEGAPVADAGKIGRVFWVGVDYTF